MIHLVLARHGNTFEKDQTPLQVGAKSDLPLTNQGCEQAKFLAQCFEKKGFIPSAVFSGNLQRQIQTAQIICDTLNLQNLLNTSVSALTEIDYGDWEGLDSKTIQSKWPLEYANWTESCVWPQQIFEGSIQDHIEKIQMWLQDLIKTYPSGSKILAISSNGIIRLFQALQKERWRKLCEEKSMEQIKVKTGHYCELTVDTQGIMITSWNSDPKICL